MPDTRLLKGKNNEAGTFDGTLAFDAVTATLDVAPAEAPGVIVAEIGTDNEEHIFYATKDDVAKTISGLIRDYTNLNGGVGIEHLSGQPWETAQDVEFVNNLVDAVKEGYIYETNAIAKVDTSNFTVNGDQTAVYTSGRVVRMNQDNTKITLVVSASYSSGTGLTTVTVTTGAISFTLTDIEFAIQPKNAAIASGIAIQNSSFIYADDGGAADAYTVTLSPAPTSYTKGLMVLFKAANTNTGASTINVNSLGTKNILRKGGGSLEAGDILANALILLVYDGTQFLLINDAMRPRHGTVASSATPTINTDEVEQFDITALAVAITSMTTNLSGNPSDGQKLVIRIKDDGTSRAITWGASFAARGADLPTATTVSKVTYVGLIYNAAASTWDCVAAITEG